MSVFIFVSQVDRHIRKLDSDLARFEEDLKQQRQLQIQEPQESEHLQHVFTAYHKIFSFASILRSRIDALNYLFSFSWYAGTFSLEISNEWTQCKYLNLKQLTTS